MFKQLAADSESALAQIWKTYGDDLHKRIILIVGREEWAREVLSDVLNALWNNRRAVAGMENPVGWLHATARNKALDKLKKEWKQKRTVALEDALQPTDTIHPDETINYLELKRNMQKAIASLPEQEKKTFQLWFETDLTRKQIAERLNLSENTIKKHLSLARKAVRKFLEQIRSLFT
ncbi:MAG: RNA polymerase sigma factor [Chitinophagaceae bacterium]